MLENILGFKVANKRSTQIVNEIVCRIIEKNSTSLLACFNPHSYYLTQSDSTFKSSLLDSDWLIADGFGVLLASRILRRPIVERVTGYDIFQGVMSELNNYSGKKVFFLGSTNEVLSRIIDRCRIDFPNVIVSGTFSPPYKSELTQQDNMIIFEEIRRAHPDVLWVGMTAPKQEKWLFNNRQNIDAIFCGAIGGVFDFYAGTIKRANPAFQNFGLEWLPRLIQEPKRLWKRTFISAPIFMIHTFKHLISNR
jgi:N-acetylglucosaminyldiphosphoundecaprenol N-acetyl-beta-D-mannosaminyltransferase